MLTERIYELRVDGKPIPQPRATQTWKGGRRHSYHVDNGIELYRTLIVHAWRRLRVSPLSGPVAIVFDFVLPRPKKLMRKRMAMPSIWHESKPDLTNLMKGAEDALNDAGAFLVDDSQICLEIPIKRIASGDEPPHSTIILAEIQGKPASIAQLRQILTQLSMSTPAAFD